MTDPIWAAVDAYLEGLAEADDPVLHDALARSEAAGLPSIQVSAAQGKLLMLLARMCGARRILEIGTLGAYSTIWLAQALPSDGRIVSLEIDPRHAAVARENLAAAGVGDRVEVRVGRASDSLAAIAEESGEPFDFIFMDADKPSNPEYLEWALRLGRRGSVIVADNVVRGGRIVDATDEDPSVRGTRRLHEMLARDPRVDSTTIQTVGGKGYDGFALALMR